MSDLNELHCFNPQTGKRDGGYCAWEGDGKCMKCEAADEIERLTYNLEKCREGSAIRTRINDKQVAQIERLTVLKNDYYDDRKRLTADNERLRAALRWACNENPESARQIEALAAVIDEQCEHVWSSVIRPLSSKPDRCTLCGALP